MNRIKLLDCTLRDGGNVNEWNFGEDNIHLIIKYLAKSGINYVSCSPFRVPIAYLALSQLVK